MNSEDEEEGRATRAVQGSTKEPAFPLYVYFFFFFFVTTPKKLLERELLRCSFTVEVKQLAHPVHSALQLARRLAVLPGPHELGGQS